MESALFTTAAIVTAAFHGPTWAWASLLTLGVLVALGEALD